MDYHGHRSNQLILIYSLGIYWAEFINNSSSIHESNIPSSGECLLANEPDDSAVHSFQSPIVNLAFGSLLRTLLVTRICYFYIVIIKRGYSD